MKNISLIVLFGMLAFFSICRLSAAELLISPVNIDIPSGEKAAILKLQNNSNSPMKIQIRIRNWDSSDTTQSKPKVIASPAFLNIFPGKQQVVRIVNTGLASNIDQERLYRVFLDEIPSNDKKSEQGLLLQVRYALPLFIGGPDLSVARTNNFSQLKSIWNRAISYSHNKAINQIGFNNQANGHARISKLRFSDSTGKETVIFGGLLGYVRANSQEFFNIPPVALTTSSTLYAEINGVDVEIESDKR
ncbi:fimbria/pilus periplasmic chaperone [Pseudoalteromonas sp.]|uniref:fimbrial biogenesis chaperone n=1 Tax=Pseudoalteromonas sp. TaxID=53249 RepID=UPI001BCC61F3|nr:fimbria/pilus periplasmic chaperone [Pseudoalteromonas sp.]